MIEFFAMALASTLASPTTSASAPSQQEADAVLAKMANLYEEVCLKTFPNDAALDAAMAAKGAKPMSEKNVRITFRDDPGRAWDLADGSGTVWLELPPYHACSVRWSSSLMPSTKAYESIASAYEQSVGGFSVIDPYDDDQGDIHVHMIGESRAAADGRHENLIFVEQQISDPKRRAAGETGYSLRFVHQIVAPGKN